MAILAMTSHGQDARATSKCVTTWLTLWTLAAPSALYLLGGS